MGQRRYQATRKNKELTVKNNNNHMSDDCFLHNVCSSTLDEIATLSLSYKTDFHIEYAWDQYGDYNNELIYRPDIATNQDILKFYI